MAFETRVETYTSDGEYQRHANKLGKDGWEPSNSAWHQPRSGCMRYLLTGGLALIWKPKPKLTVTYRRQRET